ncbi:MAG: SlyX family protein [Kiritimatiellae bacterium]|nr:SlyX family protein [Kiritimatiellia bacterium]
MSDERLTELESSMAFLEKTVQDLSDAVYQQQEKIDRLSLRLQATEARLALVEQPETDEPEPEAERPPHY